MAEVLNLWWDDHKTLGGMQQVDVVPVLAIFTS